MYSCPYLQVAYHGVPDKAYEVFVNGLRTRLYEQGLIIPSLEDHNPAGMYGTGNMNMYMCAHKLK